VAAKPFPGDGPLDLPGSPVPCQAAIELAVGASAHRIGRARMQRYRGRAVACGSSRMAAVLAERLRRECRRVVTIEPDPEDRGRADTVVKNLPCWRGCGRRPWTGLWWRTAV